jgi:hypothetical protein
MANTIYTSPFTSKVELLVDDAQPDVFTDLECITIDYDGGDVLDTFTPLGNSGNAINVKIGSDTTYSITYKFVATNDAHVFLAAHKDDKGLTKTFRITLAGEPTPVTIQGIFTGYSVSYSADAEVEISLDIKLGR